MFGLGKKKQLPKKRRMIEGREFRLYGIYNSKRKANEVANNRRDAGFYARVIKVDKEYEVYINWGWYTKRK